MAKTKRPCPICKGKGGVTWIGGCSPCFSCMGTGDADEPSAADIMRAEIKARQGDDHG